MQGRRMVMGFLGVVLLVLSSSGGNILAGEEAPTGTETSGAEEGIGGNAGEGGTDLPGETEESGSTTGDNTASEGDAQPTTTAPTQAPPTAEPEEVDDGEPESAPTEVPQPTQLPAPTDVPTLEPAAEEGEARSSFAPMQVVSGDADSRLGVDVNGLTLACNGDTSFSTAINNRFYRWEGSFIVDLYDGDPAAGGQMMLTVGSGALVSGSRSYGYSPSLPSGAYDWFVGVRWTVTAWNNNGDPVDEFYAGEWRGLESAPMTGCIGEPSLAIVNLSCDGDLRVEAYVPRSDSRRVELRITDGTFNFGSSFDFTQPGNYGRVWDLPSAVGNAVTGSVTVEINGQAATISRTITGCGTAPEPETNDIPLEVVLGSGGAPDTSADGATATWTVSPAGSVTLNPGIQAFQAAAPLTFTAVVQNGVARTTATDLPLGAYTVCLDPVLTGGPAGDIRIADDPICQVVTLNQDGPSPAVAAFTPELPDTPDPVGDPEFIDLDANCQFGVGPQLVIRYNLNATYSVGLEGVRVNGEVIALTTGQVFEPGGEPVVIALPGVEDGDTFSVDKVFAVGHPNSPTDQDSGVCGDPPLDENLEITLEVTRLWCDGLIEFTYTAATPTNVVFEFMQDPTEQHGSLNGGAQAYLQPGTASSVIRGTFRFAIGSNLTLVVYGGLYQVELDTASFATCVSAGPGNPETWPLPLELALGSGGAPDTSADGTTATWTVSPAETVTLNPGIQAFQAAAPLTFTAVVQGGIASTVAEGLTLGPYTVCLAPVLAGGLAGDIRIADEPLCQDVMLTESGPEPDRLRFEATIPDLNGKPSESAKPGTGTTDGDESGAVPAGGDATSQTTSLPNTGAGPATTTPGQTVALGLASLLLLLGGIAVNRLHRRRWLFG